MSNELEGAVAVEFPLRGEWVAFNSPGDRIPSHGVDLLGQRFAYDFVRFDRRRGWRVHPHGRLRSMLGVPVREHYGWGQPTHMPFDGEIVDARDGFPERGRIIFIREIAALLRNSVTFDPSRRGLQPIIGNFVIARAGDVYALFAHLTPGSVAVTAGQTVASGAIIGRVGHTGNSTGPHLHFQLMDSPDLLTANGMACSFREYEVERDGRWEVVRNAVPRRAERIRAVSR